MNSLFIGIGGAGCSAVAVFARKIRNHGTNVNNAFLYLDTDKGICESFPFIKDNDEFISLSGSVKQRGHTIQNIIDEALNKVTTPGTPDVQKRKFSRFLQWYDRNIESKEELTKGAEGIRMMSRAMLFANYPEIKKRIRSKMTYKDPADGQQKIRKIYVISGTCGGTGSGCVIDILYLLNQIRTEQNAQATELPINLLLVMPQGYINGIPDNSTLYTSYRTNAYAIVDEINALLKDYYGYFSRDTDTQYDNAGNPVYTITNRKAGMKMNDFSCVDEGGSFQFNVFQNAFLFDSVTADGQDMSHEQRSENVANFLFSLEVGTQANAVLDSNISNNVRTEKYNSAGKEFIHAFAASGMYVAQSWEELTRKYVREKFLYQMLLHGFVGTDSKIPAELLSIDATVFGNKIQDIITSAKNERGSGVCDLLAKILGGYDYDGLAEIMQDIKDAISVKKTVISKIFANSNSKTTVNALASTLDQVLAKVKETTNDLSEEWLKKYNLNRALQLVKMLDGICDLKFKGLAKQINDFKIEKYSLIRKEEKRRADCSKLLDMYVDFLIYRALSYENEGYLDDCKACISAAINAIGVHDYKRDGRRIVDWELDFIKYLNELSTDNTRSVWPSLDGLYNAANSCLIKGNSVERDYASLVMQTEEGDDPDMTYDLNRAQLLSTYKHNCFEAIERRDAKWTGYFDMSQGPDIFARNILVAFETFEEEVVSQGFILSNSPSLKKPFTNLTLSNTEQTQLANTIQAFDHVTLATQYQMQEQPHVSIYVGDFNNLPWLDARLFPPGFNQMQNSRAQDSQMSDRVIKLYVEFGHPLDDYRFFKDVYKPFFIAFHTDNLKQQRHHQPFIDRRFFELGDVHAFFLQTEKNEETKELNMNMKGHKSDFLKFCAWFLYGVLKAHESEGFLYEKGLSSKKYYRIESSKAGKSKKSKDTVVFGMTHDFDTWKDHNTYEPSAEVFRIEMEKEYRDSDVKSYSDCFDLWYRILQENKDNEFLDSDKLVEAFEDARAKMHDPRNLSLSRFLRSLAVKYTKTNSEGNSIVDWKQLFDDFLTIFPVKKR